MHLNVAQIVGQALAFLLFFLVLRKYAWGPILELIDKRNAEIEERFSRAEKAESKAEDLRAKYEAHLKEIEAQAREKIQAAIGEGRRVAEEIAENARADADRILEKARQSTEIELGKARIELKNEIVNMTLAATEKLIRERCDETRHRQLVEGFVEELSRQQ